MTPDTAIGHSTSMLGIFDTIQVNNAEKIDETDRLFCENLQDKLYSTLTQLDGWYNYLKTECDKYKVTHNIKYKNNGTVDYNEPYHSFESIEKNFERFCFLPFNTLNGVIELRQKAIVRFINSIIYYFNQSYKISVELPEVDEDNMPANFRPQYMDYVDLVIHHLGGANFREKAEGEIITNLHNAVNRWERHDKPDLRGKTIILYNMVSWSSFSFQHYKQYKLEYDSQGHLGKLCAGLGLFSDNSINSDIWIIKYLNTENVDITEKYPLNLSTNIQLKFFKNRRLDIHFADEATARECFKKLKLNQI